MPRGIMRDEASNAEMESSKNAKIGNRAVRQAVSNAMQMSDVFLNRGEL